MRRQVRLFVFSFSGIFERCVRQEIVRRDLTIECRRPGVLMARGLLGPTILAVCRAARLALNGESNRTQSAKALFRAARGHPETRVRGRPLKLPIGTHTRGANQ